MKFFFCSTNINLIRRFAFVCLFSKTNDLSFSPSWLKQNSTLLADALQHKSEFYENDLCAHLLNHTTSSTGGCG